MTREYVLDTSDRSMCIQYMLDGMDFIIMEREYHHVAPGAQESSPDSV